MIIINAVSNTTAPTIPATKMIAVELPSDDASRFSYVYLLRTKDETLKYFKIYKAEIETQLLKAKNGRQ